jgi:cyclophilin family peptidyl-prolyl cis-trans isomerase
MKRIITLALSLLIIANVAFADKDKKKKEKNTYVEVKTTMGTMVLKLYNETPLHRDNFINNVKTKQYDSVLFHRVIKAFMIQGGDPTSKKADANAMLGSGDIPGVTRIPAEFNPALYHKKGALAAARDGNPEKASSNCQFYIVQGKTFTDADLDRMQQYNGWKYTTEQREMYKTIGGTPHLDNNYTVYGELVAGMDVLDAIANVKVGTADRPAVDVRITETKILKKFKVKKEKKEKKNKKDKDDDDDDDKDDLKTSKKKEKSILQQENAPKADTEK